MATTTPISGLPDAPVPVPMTALIPVDLSLNGPTAKASITVLQSSIGGPIGPQGLPGPTGPAGSDGVVGAQGPQGNAGPTGPQGSQGVAGPVGGAGPAGPQGPVGATGSQGIQGPVGSQGPSGQTTTILFGFGATQSYTALPTNGLIPANWDGAGYPPTLTQMQVGQSLIYNRVINTDPRYNHVFQYVTTSNNASGWIDLGALSGPIGPQGPTGPQGSVGSAGTQGPAGPTGPQGTQGTQGTQGAVGPQGIVGPANPYIVITSLTTSPPNVNNPVLNPPTGLLVGDTDVPDPIYNGLPTGGTAGQVLIKNSATNFDAGWVVPPTADVGRNKFHNSLFRVQQRGIGGWNWQNTAGYGADRWWSTANLDAFTQGIVAAGDVNRAQIGDEELQFLLSNGFTGNAGAGAFSFTAQRMERAQRFSGKSVTVSFWANASAALKLAVSAQTNFGTGGSPSATVYGNGVAVTLATTFARYSVTLAIPSTAGMTFGTNGDDNQQINFWFSSGANWAGAAAGIGVQSGTINLWGMQCEIGTQMTALEKPDLAIELANCKRFYTTGQFLMAGYASAISQTVGSTYSIPQMRAAAPAVVATANSNANLGAVAFVALTNGYAIWVSALTLSAGTFTFNQQFTASADL